MKLLSIEPVSPEEPLFLHPTAAEEKSRRNNQEFEVSDGDASREEDPRRVIATLQQRSAALEAQLLESKRSEGRLRNLLETATQALHHVGPDGTILWANEAELAVLGYTGEEYIGCHISNFHADQHVIDDILTRLARGERLRDYRARLKCKDGSLRTVLIDSSVLWEEGKFIHTQCFTRDITDQECAAIALQETQARLEAELADSKLLQSVSAELISEQNIDALYQKLVNAAVSIMRSDFASMQMFYPERGARGELRLLASHGFNEEAQRCWEWVSHETASSCGEVLRSGRRVIATDVEKCEFLISMGGLKAYLAAGIHLMQSTPLISRSGELVGMISTHWCKSHEPNERDLRLFDILVRQAADVVERMKAEMKLRESQERYRNLFDSIDQGFCTVEVIFDNNGKAIDYEFLLVNPAFESQTGISSATGRRMREIAPLHEEHWFETYGRIALTGEPLRFENQAAQLGRYYEVYAWRVGAPEEHKVGILFNDTTERRRAEETERRLAAIVEHSKDAIISIDLDGVIRSWNQGAEHLYGYNREEAIRKAVSILIPQNRENEDPSILNRIRRGETVEHYETVRRRKDGALVDISLTVSPLKDSDNRVIGASKVARDITERVRARETLEQTVAERTAQLRNTVAELESFSYSIAHDMRAPLRSMNGYARFLEQDFGEMLPEEGKDFLRRIASSAGRLDRLITDVLNYSKITRGEMRLEKVDVEKLTREIVDTYPNLSQSNATILVQSPMPAVVGNPAALTQCVSNLLSNAVKFVAPGRKPQVRIRAERREDIVRLCVEDNGMGIDQEGQKRIFRMFQRLNAAADFEGTGIGLTIVQKAVERMGGDVGVESKLGVGSIFWIELKSAK